ncbi:GTPase [Aeromicrobium duanguangcaii]|uniref:GTPase n=1 Tax=Aeromicrobium duanguangcaii TaxID=2968086 RepID=UPI002016DFEB|nr:GTPase [Aeromicrobium duanguangcaii]MCL3836861.1 50S ribosome-binding GTPase [Aeromicrobium duanguangcaii]
MTVNLFKESSAAARALGAELRGILAELDPASGRPLLDRLSIEVHPTPLLVFTGYHSSGKSTLIEALTNRVFNVPIGSGVTTDDVIEYDWDGDVRLVDTPGVHAGRPHHDERAEQALQAADLVLFATPVELFDDTLVDHLRDVLGRLGKARQTLIVITKAGTMPSVPGVRAQAIKDALGPFDGVAWVACDAQYYLDGLEMAETAPAESAAFVEASGMAKVADLINNFAGEQGEMGRLSQPLQLLLAISMEAAASLTDDPNEQAALFVLARQRSALSKKRILLDDLLRGRAAQFRTDAVRVATLLVDSIERDEQGGVLSEAELDGHLDTLNEGLDVALERFEAAVRRVLEVQFEDLASEVLEIEASPYGRVAVQLGDVASASFDGRDIDVKPGSTPVQSPPTWAGDLTKYLKHFNKFWGASDGVKAAAGSNGHKIVLKVGHAFGKKFKPWEAVKTANTIGKFAKVGGAAVAVGMEAYGVFAEERAAVKAEHARTARRRSISQEILSQADLIVADALRLVGDDLDEIFQPELERIDAVASVIHSARSVRSDLRGRLSSVQERASAALTAF